MEPYDIDDIFNKANELGLLIQGTDVYRNYREMADAMAMDERASKMLDTYEKRLRELDERKRIGDIIESYELEEVRDLADDIEKNELIMRYLAAKREYAVLLERIQQSITEDSTV